MSTAAPDVMALALALASRSINRIDVYPEGIPGTHGRPAPKIALLLASASLGRLARTRRAAPLPPDRAPPPGPRAAPLIVPPSEKEMS